MTEKRSDSMYYCLICQKLHVVTKRTEESVFLTGFVFVDNTKYQAGLCLASDAEQEEGEERANAS